ncbi:652_t:CDS:2 [Entrophospora sp. SA101]|nr:20489_t:CDS:2 [Entrophospora sp. SA101]CAJ0760967.1 652_t:CDS:2 [Entrophospora sp. SA101]
MERYLSDETNLLSYANKLKEFERKDFHWFSVLDGTEIEPESVDPNQIKNDTVKSAEKQAELNEANV